MALGHTVEALGSPEKPVLIHIGQVAAIEPPQEQKPSEYTPFITHSVKVHLTPLQGTSGNSTNFRLRFNPAHLNADFNPSAKALKDELGDKHAAFVRYYNQNIYGTPFGKSGYGPSLLQGICGLDATNEEVIGEISNRFQADGPVTAEKFYEVLAETLQAGEIGQFVGYIQTQQPVNAGPDETGKNQWVPGQYYEVRSRLSGFGSGLFYPTPENIKQLSKIAGKSNGKYQLTFGEEAVPF